MNARQMRKLQELTALIYAQPDLNSLTAHLQEVSIRVFEVAHCALFLMKSGWDELQGIRPGDDAAITFPKGEGLAGIVADEGECLLIENVTESPVYNEAIDGIENYTPGDILSAPIRTSKGDIVGVIQLIDKLTGRFKTRDEDLLLNFSCQIGEAVLTAKRLDEWKRFAGSALESIAGSIDAKYPSTVGHTERVRDYALAVAEYMGISGQDLENIRQGANLHNLGRLAFNKDISDLNLHEESGQNLLFTEAIIKEIDFPAGMEKAGAIAVSWNEHIDGSGTPKGLRGEQIPLGARIIAVCDRYDTMFFRAAKDDGSKYSVDEILESLQEKAGSELDADVVDVFISKKVYNQEKRRHKRIEYTGKLDIISLNPDGTDGTAIRTQLLDLSSGGVLFHSETQIPLSTMLKLRIYLATGVMQAIVRTARVFPGKESGFRIGAYFIWSSSGR